MDCWLVAVPREGSQTPETSNRPSMYQSKWRADRAATREPISLSVYYWIDWAQKSRKNGLTCKRKKCCSTRTMHRATSSWKRPGGNLQAAWYRASTAEGFAVLAPHWYEQGLSPARLQKVTWMEVVHRYWTLVPCQHWNLYWFSTDITPKSVVSRHLVSGLEL